MRKFRNTALACLLALCTALACACTANSDSVTETVEAGTENTTGDMTEAQTGAADETAETETETETTKVVEYKSITIFVEGISEELYYGTVNGTVETVRDVLQVVVDCACVSLEESNGYISAIEDDVAGTFGGWDGWLYRVNGVEPSVGMSDYEVSDGDLVVIYYGDPYGVGMQYPEATLEGNTVTFISNDAVYDESYNVTYTQNPVVGATVTWNESTYVTDENGCITLSDEDAANVPDEKYRSIEKTAENGCPLVLRCFDLVQ